MSDEIIVAIIAAFGTIISVFITNARMKKDILHELKLEQQVFKAHVEEKIGALKESQEEQIGALKKSQDKHNNMIERTYKLETQQSVQGERISSLENRVNVLDRRT